MSHTLSTVVSAWVLGAILSTAPTVFAEGDTRLTRSGLTSTQLGADFDEVSRDVQRFFGSKKDVGVLVSRVQAKDTAAKAGVRVGDLLIAIDDKPIVGPDDILLRLLGTRPGDRVRVKVLRNRRIKVISLRLEREPVRTIVERRGTGFTEIFSFDDSDPFGTMDSASPEKASPNRSVTALLRRIAELEQRLAELEQQKSSLPNKP